MDVPDLLEFAKAQLLELRVYDDMLDRELDLMNTRLIKPASPSVWKIKRYEELASKVMLTITDLTNITEKIDNILVIPADLGWSDIGSWKTLHDVLVAQTGNDLVVQTEGEHIGVNNQHCLIIGKKKLIATVGLSDIVIVETDDALLVAHKSAAQDVKQIIEKLKETNKHDLL